MQKKETTVPKKYLGKWIAWNHQATKILASGKTFREARQAAKEQGEEDPLMEKVPHGMFVGG